MLGLPDGVAACLFDLDGVLTDTAAVHNRAWTEMFDAYLKGRAERLGGDFVPFDPASDYPEYVDGRPRADGVRAFLASRNIELPDGGPDDPPDAETVHGLGNRKNVLLLGAIERDGVRGVRRLAGLPGRGQGRGAAPGGGLFQRQHQAGPRCHRAGRVRRGASSTAPRCGQSTCAESRRRTPSWPRPSGSASGRTRAAVFEDATSGVEAGRAGGFGCVVGVDRVGQAAELREHGADVVVSDLAELLAGRAAMIDRTQFPVEPWTIRETCLDLDLLAQAESVFALSNGHIGLRGNLDEGEPHGMPGTYLGSFYELRPLPYAESGYGYPESGQTVVNVTNGKLIRLLVDDEPFDVRYGQLHDHERVLDLRAGMLTGSVDWTSPAGRRIRVRSTRLVSFDPAGGRRDQLRGGAGRRPGPGDRAVGAGRQRDAAARAAHATRGSPPCWNGRWSRWSSGVRGDGRRPGAPHPAQRPADGRRDGPRHRGARPGRRRDRVRRGLGPHHGGLQTGARPAAAGGQVPRVRLVERAVAAGAARPGRAAR